MSGKSRIEKILENLLGGDNVIEPPIGRDEKILYSILNDTEYTDTPHSIFEDLLIAIKTGNVPRTAYVYSNLSRDEKILFCKLNRLEYFEPPHSRLERLLIRWLYLDLYLNIEGVPPFTFISNGSPIIDYTINGNTIQNDAPAPASPVIPQGIGEMTKNLFDQSDFSLLMVTPTAYRYGTSVGILPQGTYTFNATKSAGGQSIYLTAKLDNTYSQTTISTVPFTFVADGVSEYIIRTAINTGTTWSAEKYSDMMLNLGSTALPYEPYGYKLDISCGDTVTPIYLGEVVTTRKIKKLVLTGEENFVYDSNYTRFRFVMPNSLIIGVRRTPVICTHYEALTDGRPIEEVINNTIYSDSARQNRWWIEDKRFSSANDFKAYLAEQYAAGTPVTIWYILAEPETAIVNEPLMKIGDYADEINYEQTVVSIPTVSGRNTFDVLGDIKPSNVELTYAPRAPLLGKRKTVLKK